jgi:IS605 OrfB family transposase
VKLVVQVKLLPTQPQEQALLATLAACNEAANRVAKVAFDRRCFRNFDLRRHVYHEIKNVFGLSAQPAQHVIKKVADAYTTLPVGVAAGHLGEKSSARRSGALGRPVRFRPNAAQPFDDRCLSWQLPDRTISIWTVHGRTKRVAFTCSAAHFDTLTRYRKGESDLVHRDGKWFLVATCEVPAAPSEREPTGWLGVDRGIVNIATTSDGKNHCGAGLERYRRRQARVRAELQAKGTKSAKRRLRRRAKRETRHIAHTNHKIANEIVADAERTGRGIALENLLGIRGQVRLHRHQRAALSNWSFHDLGRFITYKAVRAGVPVLEVDPAYTSQTCPVGFCGSVSRKNRPNRDTFLCRSCGFAGPADLVAALNVARRAGSVWAFVDLPDAASSPSPRTGQSGAANPWHPVTGVDLPKLTRIPAPGEIPVALPSGRLTEAAYAGVVQW